MKVKARDKRTGEIVEVERYGADGSCTVFRNYEEIVEAEDTIDWEQRRYEIAKEILPNAAIAVKADPKEWMNGMSYPKASAILAINYADALIEELKKTLKDKEE